MRWQLHAAAGCIGVGCGALADGLLPSILAAVCFWAAMRLTVAYVEDGR